MEDNTAEIIELVPTEEFEVNDEPVEETKEGSRFGLGVLVGTGVTLATVAIANKVRKWRNKKDDGNSEESDQDGKKSTGGIMKWFHKKDQKDETEENEG